MPKLTVDGLEIEVPPGSTVLQACEAAGREIPVFCFHPRLNIAGNCRMCLVEMEKSPKPDRVLRHAGGRGHGDQDRHGRSCTRRARACSRCCLINHPLDCPICDQGGECDLQDLTLFYGPDHSRFKENKRTVTDKELGPADLDPHDPLHPLHALHPLPERGRRHRGARGHRPRRAHGDRHLDRARGHVGAAGQHDRHLPGRRAQLQALRVPGAARGNCAGPNRSTSWTRSAATSGSMPAAPRSCGSCRACTRTSTRSGSPTRPALPMTA